MWNGVNYLLKIPSDLDYLGDYLAIKRWVGFTLTRNPFCVPYPMEEGQALLTGKHRAHTLVKTRLLIHSHQFFSYARIVKTNLSSCSDNPPQRRR
jgi:hypothetical protein